MVTRNDYEPDDEAFPEDAYRVAGWGQGIAWRVLGWETEPNEDTVWTGFEVRTGNILVVMIGDDRHFSVDPEDVTPLDHGTFCWECGQIGCMHGAEPVE